MSNSESNRIEYKEQLNDDFEQEVIAFLNYKEGGIIYVGVNKNGQAINLSDIDSIQLKIKDRIKQNISPSTLGLFDVVVEEFDGKEVIKVIISSGTEKPYYLRRKGRTPEGCYIRVGSSKERMTFEMIDDMYAKRVKNSLKEIESLRQELTFNQLKIHYEGKDLQLNENFLKNLDLLTSEGKYNYNAFLLADENNISIKVVKYLGTDKMDLIENKEYGYRCLITATQSVLDRLEVENTVYAKIEYKGRKEVEMIDSKAMKEAVINAIVHNDYSYGNSPIIELYSDRIEITSAGGLPQELSQSDFFKGVTAPRNKELIRVFKDINLIENIGSGILRILKAYKKDSFVFMDNFLRVSFKYKKNPFNYESQNDENEKNVGKSSKKSSKKAVSKEAILQLCSSEKSLKEIVEYFGYKDIYKFKNKYINTLLKSEKLRMTIPEQPKNRNQKYISINQR